MIRWKELTSAGARAVSLAEAKLATRVIDTASIATQASRTMGSGNSTLVVNSKISGAIGNQYSVRVLVAGLNTALSVTFASNILTINTSTDGAGVSTSTVNDVIAKIYETPEAAAVFEANNGAGTGTGTLLAASVAALTGGVDSGDEDAYLGLLIDAATEVVERRTGKVLIQRTFKAFYDDWPCDDEMVLPVSPVSAITLVEYLDYSTGNAVTWNSTNYTSDLEDPDLPARIVRNENVVYPMLSAKPNPVQVSFTAGYGTSSSNVPSNIKQCILFLVAHWYANREPVISGTATLSNKVPFTFEVVLNSFRLINVL